MLKRKKIETDLCVIGGGMSGICTAIAAARCGIQVVLMHERPVLGGNASSEIRMGVSGAHGDNNLETGILEEIILENYYRNPTKNYYIWDTVLYEFVRREKNIVLLLNCTCQDAEVENGTFSHGRNRRIVRASGYQMTSQTFIDVYAKYYADCSGDSILAPLTGAEYRVGRESRHEYHEATELEAPDSYTMGNSCLIQGRETVKPINFVSPEWALKLGKEDFQNREPDIYNDEENFWYLELGGTKDTIHDAEGISEELISLALGTWDYVKNSGQQETENFELEFLGFLPGKRESRRLTGEYTITQTDICGDVQFDDTVAFGGWPIDDHFPGGFYHKGVPNTDFKTPAPYCIPYRILYSKNVDNLFFAGRNISATHAALSSLRVMATCSLMGQAVGTAAALAVKYGISPHDVYEDHMEELQEQLMNDDSFLPNKRRKLSPQCNVAHMVNGSAELCNGQDRANRVYNTQVCGKLIQNNKVVKYVFDEPEMVNAVHVVFDSDLCRRTVAEGASKNERISSMRSNVLLNSPVMRMPQTLCKKFTLYVIDDTGRKQICTIDNNRKRAYHIPVATKVSAIELVLESNWGGTEKTTLISFDFN